MPTTLAPRVVQLHDENRTRIQFNSFCDLYIKHYAKPHKRSWDKDARRIKQYFIPAFGTLQLRNVQRHNIAALHRKVGTKHPYEANRLLEQLSKMFEVAKDWGYFPEMVPNPAKRIRKYKELSRERYIRESEMPALAAAINAEGCPYVRAALWLYLMLGFRKSELLTVRWADVDLERANITVRKTQTKSGRTHYLPLPSPAIKLLADLQRVDRNPYVFPSHLSGRPGKPRRGIDSAWRRVRARAKLEDVRLHDTRRTVGSWLCQSGKSLQLVGRVLNITNAHVAEVYSRLVDAGVSDALEGHASEISRFMDVRAAVEAPQPSAPQDRAQGDPPQNANIRILGVEQVLIEAKFIVALQRKPCTKSDLYSKLGSQFKVNRFEMQRILDEMTERQLIRRVFDRQVWRYELCGHSMSEVPIRE